METRAYSPHFKVYKIKTKNGGGVYGNPLQIKRQLNFYEIRQMYLALHTFLFTPLILELEFLSVGESVWTVKKNKKKTAIPRTNYTFQ